MLNVAVIGCGYWGKNIIRDLYDNAMCNLKYCCDTDKAKLDLLSSKSPAIKPIMDSEEIFKDKSIDAVFIITPVGSHYALAKRALECGKAVFVEKPFVDKLEKAVELTELAEKNKLVLMIGHIFEYAPAVIKIKELIKTNQLGKIYYISSTRVNLGIHRKDESVIWDLAAHDLSTIFNWLDEEPLSVQGIGKSSIIENKPDVAFINLRFPSDILVNIQISWLAPIKMRNTVIVGSEKMVVFDDTSVIEKVKVFDKGIDKLEHSSFGEFQLSYRTGEIAVPVISNAEPLKEEIKHFIDCVKNKKEPKTNGKSATRVVKYLEMIEKSVNEGGKVYVNSVHH
ncbi:MAG: Gfo/Idh/MocA family oxidoreductase [bacterium]